MSIESGKYFNKTATGLVITGAGLVYGVIVNSNSSGTMKLWDGLTATGGVIVDTYTFPAGSTVVTFPKAVEFYTGLFLTVGGTVNLDIIAAPNVN